MKPLTLVQLAQALEDGKTIEFDANTGRGFCSELDFDNSSGNEIKRWLKLGRIRIKPEPREYMICPKTGVSWEKNGDSIVSYDPKNGIPDAANAIHVREVIE